MKKFLLSIFALMLAVFSVQAEEASWQMVTNASTLKAGDKIVIVAKDSNKAIGKEQANNNRKSAAVNKNGNTVSWTAYVQEITLETGTVDGTFAFYVEGSTGKATKGYLYAASSSSNYLKTQITNNANGSWAITISADGIATIKAKGTNSRNLLKYNKSSDLFSCYSSGQNDVCIYKYTLPGEEGGDEPVVTPPAAPTLPEETSFTDDEFVVEITNNADNAIVYYSLNNENDWVEGSTITIDETTTVYAKAVDADDETNESEVVSATYTKVVLPDAGEATEVTGNAAVNYGTATINDIKKFEVAPVTLTFAKNDGQTQPAYNKAGDCRIYAKGSITATCAVGNLTKIVFTVSEQGKKRLTDLTPSVGTVRISDDHSTITWEGNAAEVVMTVGEKAVYGTDGSDKAGQICFTEFTASYAIPSSSYTLSVTDAGWATLYLDFTAAIPADVEAYIVKADGINKDFVTLTQVTSVLPANTGVIVKASEGNYTFAYSKETLADVTGNLLKGSVADKNVEGEAYVLGNVDGVGLYKAKMNGTSWLNNANKAYLPASAVPASAALSAGFRFDFGGTTAIEEVETEAAETVIYDLTGRRVNEITKAGVYVVGGRKILVK